tara:strand:+ start:608 stop:1189 length:582 start_codon:yes stop_codon:yes gene_type:complete
VKRSINLITLVVALLLVSGTAVYAERYAENHGAVESVKLYRLQAEQGDLSAQIKLGLNYEFGIDVPQDYKEAAKWFRLSAEQGWAPAQTHLGVAYDFGDGVPQDRKEAVKWYRLAAEQGYAHGQAALGNMYQSGFGVLQDNLRAHMWLNIAAANGVDEARELRDDLAKTMVPADVSKAQQMARECLEKNYKGC